MYNSIYIKNEEIICKELLVRHYKSILKTTYGEKLNESFCIKSIIQTVSNLIDKPTEWFYSLNLIDFLRLIIHIRSNTMGNVINLSSINDSKEKMNIELNLNNVLDILTKIQQQDKISLNDCHGLTISFPSIKNILDSKNQIKDYISRFSYKKEDWEPTTDQVDVLYANLTLKNSILIKQNIKKLNEQLYKINLFSTFNIETLNLFFEYSFNYFVWFVKLLFSEPLTVFYNNIFNLSYYGHIDASYIENCTVGEYMFFVNLLNEILNPPETS